MTTIEIRTESRAQAVDITRQVARMVERAGVEEGWCEVFVPHTTAAVTINEAADPDVMDDVLAALERLVPWHGPYRHGEGNSAAHVKSILAGASVRLPIQGGRLALGTWQGIFFLEFDGPRHRRVLADAR